MYLSLLQKCHQSLILLSSQAEIGNGLYLLNSLIILFIINGGAISTPPPWPFLKCVSTMWAFLPHWLHIFELPEWPLSRVLPLANFFYAPKLGPKLLPLLTANTLGSSKPSLDNFLSCWTTKPNTLLIGKGRRSITRSGPSHQKTYHSDKNLIMKSCSLYPLHTHFNPQRCCSFSRLIAKGQLV